MFTYRSRLLCARHWVFRVSTRESRFEPVVGNAQGERDLFHASQRRLTKEHGVTSTMAPRVVAGDTRIAPDPLGVSTITEPTHGTAVPSPGAREHPVTQRRYVH